MTKATARRRAPQKKRKAPDSGKPVPGALPLCSWLSAFPREDAPLGAAGALSVPALPMWPGRPGRRTDFAFWRAGVMYTPPALTLGGTESSFLPPREQKAPTSRCNRRHTWLSGATLARLGPRFLARARSVATPWSGTVPAPSLPMRERGERPSPQRHQAGSVSIPHRISFPTAGPVRFRPDRDHATTPRTPMQQSF